MITISMVSRPKSPRVRPWSDTPVILALKRTRTKQKDCYVSEASLDYTVRSRPGKTLAKKIRKKQKSSKIWSLHPTWLPCCPSPFPPQKNSQVINSLWESLAWLVWLGTSISGGLQYRLHGGVWMSHVSYSKAWIKGWWLGRGTSFWASHLYTSDAADA